MTLFVEVNGFMITMRVEQKIRYHQSNIQCRSFSFTLCEKQLKEQSVNFNYLLLAIVFLRIGRLESYLIHSCRQSQSKLVEEWKIASELEN